MLFSIQFVLHRTNLVGRTLYRSVMAQDQAELQPASHASILPGTIYKVGGKPAFALVLAAAALLAQLYVRRMIAFAGCLGACMLFCATLDHLVVDRIAMVASDAQAPAATRARSLDALGGTVFFRHAGYRIASGLAADGSAPAGVRDAAAAAADCLLLRLDDQPDRVRAASVNTF